MHKLLEAFSKWLSSWVSAAADHTRKHDADLPEHERRLRDMQRSGRTLLLP